ncbi:MAG: DUF167 domain-containing protein [Candidatus Nanopelagicales bacterium]|nr:DUF167 domain-containing protein [Candidatus Nanopelagicales bacterium]
MAPPADGAANAELQRLLAKRLGVSKSAIGVSDGETGRLKTVLVKQQVGASLLLH